MKYNLLGNRYTSEENYNTDKARLLDALNSIKSELEAAASDQDIDIKVDVRDSYVTANDVTSDPMIYAKISDNGNLRDEGQISVENQDRFASIAIHPILVKHATKEFKFGYSIAGLGNVVINATRANRKFPNWMKESKSSFLESYNRFAKKVITEDEEESMGFGPFYLQDKVYRNIKNAGFEDIAKTYKEICKTLKDEDPELLRGLDAEGLDSGVICPQYVSFSPWKGDNFDKIDRRENPGEYEKEVKRIADKLKAIKGVKKVETVLGPRVADYPKTTTLVEIYFDAPSEYLDYDEKILKQTIDSNKEKIAKGDLGDDYGTGNENTALYNFTRQTLASRNRRK